MTDFFENSILIRPQKLSKIWQQSGAQKENIARMDITVRECFCFSVLGGDSKHGRKYLSHFAIKQGGLSPCANDFYNEWNAFQALDSFNSI